MPSRPDNPAENGGAQNSPRIRANIRGPETRIARFLPRHHFCAAYWVLCRRILAAVGPRR